MNVNAMTPEWEEHMKHMQSLADGKIACSCGNSEWRQFLYVSGGAHHAAGCKRCGTMFDYVDGNWRETVKGPGRTE